MCELVGREDLWYYLFSFNWGKIYFSSEPDIKTINHSLVYNDTKISFCSPDTNQRFLDWFTFMVLCCRIEVAAYKEEDLQIYQIKSTKSMEDIQFKEQQKKGTR